jgi:hypothetical protein
MNRLKLARNQKEHCHGNEQPRGPELHLAQPQRP